MGINIFEGLENLGIKDISADNLFANTNSSDKDKASEELVKEEKKKAEISATEREAAMLFDKTYVCPVCDTSTKSRTVRTGHARMLGMDIDLKPNYEFIEPLKYDVIACPNCGFTAVSRYFVPMVPSQKKSILEKIAPNYRHKPEPEGVFSYEFAIERHKMALASAVVRNAKPSERAFICLKAAWLSRSWRKCIVESGIENSETINTTVELENEFLKYAYDGFVLALQSERFPICGMDEHTIDYLIAALAFELGKNDVSAKMVSQILTSLTAPSRMKDKARNLKELIIEKIKSEGK